MLTAVGLNPRPFGPEPKSGALDHSAKLSVLLSPLLIQIGSLTMCRHWINCSFMRLEQVQNLF